MNKYLDFQKIRDFTESIVKDMELKILTHQARSEVSPALWHLGHTTWFFESIVLENYLSNYSRFEDSFPKIFNSYYKGIGEHINQKDRGSISFDKERIFQYRKYVDKYMNQLLEINRSNEMIEKVSIGLNHEEQHQELLHMDLKACRADLENKTIFNINTEVQPGPWFEIQEGLYQFGHGNDSFSYDNESPAHKHYLYPSSISYELVRAKEYSEFIEAGGYKKPQYWLSKGWDWIKENNIEAPLYLQDNDISEKPVSHISYFEADAYANFRNCRLPTEFEHELFDREFNFKKALWAWTSSHYSPYPRFEKFQGALSEYNGKFMCNQFVLRGGCDYTPKDHWRPTYRNFYEPHQRWMFSGIRLTKDRYESC